ncbi:hypothetical protein, partial [Celeribacter sp.]|uniref:hypothetical protein n=1 Tax=Celeribacter sp. TaxID=1890673 RepID=UPI003A8D9E35
VAPAPPVHWGRTSGGFVVYLGADPVFSPPTPHLPRHALLWIAAALEGDSIELTQEKRLADGEALLLGAAAMLEAWREISFSQIASAPASWPRAR